MSGYYGPRDYRATRRAENTGSSPEVLERLLGNPDPHVLVGLVRNPVTPSETLRHLVFGSVESSVVSGVNHAAGTGPFSPGFVLPARASLWVVEEALARLGLDEAVAVSRVWVPGGWSPSWPGWQAPYNLVDAGFEAFQLPVSFRELTVALVHEHDFYGTGVPVSEFAPVLCEYVRALPEDVVATACEYMQAEFPECLPATEALSRAFASVRLGCLPAIPAPRRSTVSKARGGR